MKQKFLLKTMLLLCALIAGSSSVWAAEQTVTWTASTGALGSAIGAVNGTATGTIKTGTFDWDYTRTLLYLASGKNDYIAMSSGYMQCGSSNAKESLSFTTSNIPGTIKSISVDCASASAKHNLSITVDGTSYFNGATPSWSSGGNTKTGTGTKSGDIEISFTLSNPSTQGAALYIKSISVTYETTTPAHTLTYSATNGSIAGVDEGSNAVASGASIAEGATVTLTATPSTGYRFSSWSVSGTGSTLSSTSTNPTTFTMGTANATVTATFEEVVATPTFDPDGSATYTQAQNVAISCVTPGATIHYTTNGDDPTESDPTYSSPVSITISKTVLKAKAFKGGLPASDVASATYTIKPNKPTVSATGPTVTITGDDGLQFYYTTDGTAPTNSSTPYTGPFNLNADCTIKARAYDSYSNGSDVTSFTYKYFPLIPKNINSGYYVKVTNVSDLENGDAILIVNETNNVAMSTTQNDNNRGQEGVTISSSVIKIISADVQKLVLVATNEPVNEVATDVFYFYTGGGYLFAASSSKNYLRTETTPDNNARATISISSGNATITFTGSNTNNLLKYNSGSSIFSCYGSGQSAVQIYKEVAHSETLTPGKTYTTLTSAYNLDFTGLSLEAYIATAVAGGSVQMTKVNKVPANTGLVLKATTPGSAVNVPVFDGTGAEEVSANKMAGSATETTAVAENAGYILKDGVFQPSSGVGELPAGKAYLNIAYSPAAPILNLGFGDEGTTGVETLNVERGTLNDNSYYNLAGQRVAQPTKGLYIVNGKKVVIK